ncbi:zinc-binding dehydrogenase [Saccharomonospora sp. CUA-673]|uniref:zinc-binding dehydrogenase n=1 Tax=Saccharomonospora sp. CUA-673 TaxID=1904969 RepID=UPI0035110E7D
MAPANELTVVPDELSSVDAAALGSPLPVGHFALAHARFRCGDSILVRGAAGSIGIATVELAARAGASSIAVTTSSNDRGARLRELGATHVLDREGRGDTSASDSYDVIVDIAGGSAVPAFVDRLAPNGRYVIVGIVAGMPPLDFGRSLITAFQRSRSVATFSLDTVPVEDRNRVRAELFDAATRDEVRAIVHDVIGLDHAVDAHRRMEAGEVFGRIVLTP